LDSFGFRVGFIVTPDYGSARAFLRASKKNSLVVPGEPDTIAAER
jgi:hypothetical protein